MHFPQTQLADLLCSNKRSSECPVLKLTVIYCHGHIKRRTLHDLWSYAYVRLATIFSISCDAARRTGLSATVELLVNVTVTLILTWIWYQLKFGVAQMTKCSLLKGETGWSCAAIQGRNLNYWSDFEKYACSVKKMPVHCTSM